MSTYQYLAADGEVGKGATLHDSLESAKATGQIYIDGFLNGKHHKTWKRIDDNLKHPLYSDDPTKWL